MARAKVILVDADVIGRWGHQNRKYIRKAAFMNLSKSLDGAIKRCKGDLHAKPF